MFKIAVLLFLVQFFKVDSKFYETDIGPHGYGGRYNAPYGYGGQYSTYSTNEYDPEVGYPYGLSYKKYPNIPYKEVDVTRTIQYEEPIPGPLGLKYGHGSGLEYAGRLGHGGYYGAPGGYGAAGGYGVAGGYGAPGGYGAAGGYGVAGGYGAAGGYGGAGGYDGAGGYPLRIGKSLGYGYGPGSAAGYSPIYPHALGPISPHGRLDFYGHSPYGVSQIDKGIYSDGKQNIIGEQYKHVQGHNGESLNHGDVGFNKGEVAYKDVKGDSVHFVDSDGVNRGHHEGKSFSGGEHFNTEGKHGNEKVLNNNHNKGHNIKGFKKSHHLDETGKTEEFFDEDHDAGGNYAFDGRFGKFGELGGGSYKGGFNDGRFKTGEATKQGHYDNEYLVDKAQGGSGKFGGNKYAQNNEAYGLNNGFGEHGLSGHHENSNLYKNYPVGYGRFY